VPVVSSSFKLENYIIDKEQLKHQLTKDDTKSDTNPSDKKPFKDEIHIPRISKHKVNPIEIPISSNNSIKYKDGRTMPVRVSRKMSIDSSRFKKKDSNEVVNVEDFEDDEFQISEDDEIEKIKDRLAVKSSKTNVKQILFDFAVLSPSKRQIQSTIKTLKQDEDFQ